MIEKKRDVTLLLNGLMQLKKNRNKIGKKHYFNNATLALNELESVRKARSILTVDRQIEHSENRSKSPKEK